jgi:hypothetical protein
MYEGAQEHERTTGVKWGGGGACATDRELQGYRYSDPKGHAAPGSCGWVLMVCDVMVVAWN